MSLEKASPHVYPAFSGYGVEIEYMIVDGASLDVRPMTDELLRAAAGDYVAEVERGPMGWSNELALHVFEIKNQRPQPDLAGLAAAFQAEVRAANALLAPAGARLMPGGIHPWMDPAREARLWPREPAELYQAYDRIFDCRRHGWVNIQSVHLNLPFANDLEFARLHAAIRLVLPILPALAASSPFVEGRSSGWLDYRMEVYRTHQDRVPSSMGAVIPDETSSPADYQARVLAPMYDEISAREGGALLRHEWFNARAAIPRFDRNAIEIRVLDVQECPLADMAIVAAAAALVRRLYAAGATWLAQKGGSRLETAALVRLFHACIRDADRATIDDRRYLGLLGLGGESLAARDLWARLAEEMVADGSLAAEWMNPLGLILDKGPLARRIAETAGREPSRQRLEEVYRELCQCLQDGRMYRA